MSIIMKYDGMTVYIYNYRRVVMKKLVGVEGGVEDLLIEIKPRSIVYEGKIFNVFALYLEKGVQVMGTFQSGTKHNSKDTVYRFKMPQASTFRIKNISHATYTWNFYTVSSEDSTETFEDSVHFDLKRSIALYLVELQEKQKELQVQVKDKGCSKDVILEEWANIRRQMRNNKPFLKSIFSKTTIHLQFQVNILNPLDLEVQDMQKRLRRSRSDFDLPGPSLYSPKIGTKIVKAAKGYDKGGQSPRDRSQSVIQQRNKNQGFSSSPQIMLSINSEEKVDESTRVLVVNPSGQQIKHHDQGQEKTFAKNSIKKGQNEQNTLYIPNKRFETLSDIVERSHEGSSTYDYGKLSSSNGNKQFPHKLDEVKEIAGAEDHKNIVTCDSPLLSKFNTLPHQKFGAKGHVNQIDLRRARTDKKPKSDIPEQSQYQQGVSQQAESEQGQDNEGGKEIKSGTSGDKYAKYIIFIALLIIGVIISQELSSQSKTKNISRSKMPKKVPMKTKAVK